MLPQRLRLRRSTDFALVIRRGRKVTRPTLVLYALAQPEGRFGVVVGKKVGGAVTRNSVKRRLRHQAATLLDQSRPMAVVVRALPTAGDSRSRLADDFISAWRQAAKVVA